MTSTSLIQYFRSFLVKLSMIEAQIGQMYLGGEYFRKSVDLKHSTEDDS